MPNSPHTPTYEELLGLRLADLDTAVADWQTTRRGLDELARQARDGLRAKAESADWRGANAGVTRASVVAVSETFHHAFEEARGVHGVLSDLRDALRSCRDRLETLRDEARQVGLQVRPDGTVVAPPQDPNHESPSLQDPLLAGLPDGNLRPPERLAEIEDVEARIAAVLAEAAEYDGAAQQALRDLAGPDGTGFADGAWRDLDAAREWYGEQDAQLALALMTGEGPRSVTDAELARLNELLTEHAHNEAFATHLVTELGARGTLEFWDQLLNPGFQGLQPAGGEEDRTRLLTDLRSGLGATLGLATRSDDPAMQAWERDMIALGEERFGDDDYGDPGWQPYGYQLMSSLMATEGGEATGRFGQDFLTDYGTALLAFERGMDPPGAEWATASTSLSPTGLGDDAFRLDPMTGYLEALSRNPPAATELLGGDGTMQYLLVDRQADHAILPGETNEGYSLASLDATGNALIAATTGLDPNDLSAAAVNDDRHDDLRDLALEVLAEPEEEFAEELRMPMAQVLVSHGNDFVTTMHAAEASELTQRPMDKSELYDVVTQISQSDDSYAMLNEGMNYVLADMIVSDQGNPELDLRATGKTIGFLEEARLDALRAGTEDGTSGATDSAKWANYVAGTAVTFIPGGGGLYAAGGAIASDLIIEAWVSDEQARFANELEEAEGRISNNRDAQLGALRDLWWSENSEWAQSTPGYTHPDVVLGEMETGVNDGKDL